MAQVGVETDVAARRGFFVGHRLSRGMGHQLVEAGGRGQLIPIHPVDTPDLLVTRATGPPAQQEVMLSTVQADPGVGAGPVDELPVSARLYAFQPGRMNTGVAHQPFGHCHAPSKSSVGMLALVPASYTLSPHSAKTTSMQLVPSVVSLHSVQSVSGP